MSDDHSENKPPIAKATLAEAIPVGPENNVATSSPDDHAYDLDSGARVTRTSSSLWCRYIFLTICGLTGIGLGVGLSQDTTNNSSATATAAPFPTPSPVSPCTDFDIEEALLGAFGDENCVRNWSWQDIGAGELIYEIDISEGAEVVANYTWSAPTDVMDYRSQPKALRGISFEEGMEPIVIVDLQFSSYVECNFDEASPLIDMVTQHNTLSSP